MAHSHLPNILPAPENDTNSNPYMSNPRLLHRKKICIFIKYIFHLWKTAKILIKFLLFFRNFYFFWVFVVFVSSFEFVVCVSAYMSFSSGKIYFNFFLCWIQCCLFTWRSSFVVCGWVRGKHGLPSFFFRCGFSLLHTQSITSTDRTGR